MTVAINRIDRSQILGLISQAEHVRLSAEDRSTLDHCLLLTSSLWVGSLDGKMVCTWGLIPPTLMSEQAYLWLYTTEAVIGNEFLFVRNSQRAVETMLEEYPTIVGYTKTDQERSIRWLRWLGAEFGDPVYDGKALPFTIRKKH